MTGWIRLSSVAWMKRFPEQTTHVATWCAGLSLGIVLTAMLLQFFAVWGRDRQVSTFAIGAVVLACAVHARLIPVWSSNRRLATLTAAAAGLIYPLWLEGTQGVIDTLLQIWADCPTSLISGLAVAFGLFPALTLGGAVWSHVLTPEKSRLLTGIGLVCGLLGTSLGFGVSSSLSTSVIFGGLLAVIAFLADRKSTEHSWLAIWNSQSEVRKVAAKTSWAAGCVAMVVAIMVTASLSLLMQLFPTGLFLAPVGIGGFLLGVFVASALLPQPTASSLQRLAAMWLGVAGLAAAVLLVANPLVEITFVTASTIQSATLLLAWRVGVILLVSVPAGLLLGVHRPLAHAIIAADPRGWGGLCLGALVSAWAQGLGISAPVQLAACSLLSLAAAVLMRAHIEFGLTLPRQRLLVATPIMLSLATPWLASQWDASRPVKLLFNTSALLAYQSNSDRETLTVLDDQRMIESRSTWHGPVTVWRNRGSQLHVRQAGIPNGLWSEATNIHPQSLSETLFAVYPLVLSERTDRVLLHGLGLGAALEQVLEFPVQHVDLLAGDPAVLQLVQKLHASDSHPDSLQDQRVHSLSGDTIPALQARGANYDLILSSPPPAALAQSSAYYTTEFYRAASRKLTERGLFCQRIEALDFGVEPLRCLMVSLQETFRETALVECGVGEYLLLGTNAPQGLIQSRVVARLQAPQVERCLTRCGWDWSAILTLSAYDHNALREIVEESGSRPNSSRRLSFALMAPGEVARWGHKRLDVQLVLTATRLSEPSYHPYFDPELGTPQITERSRQSRLLDWIGADGNDPFLLRRLSEVAAHDSLIVKHPDSFWWEYRKALREQLQKRPRSEISQVAYSESETQSLHPEDARRKGYFAALGAAMKEKTPSLENLAAVESHLSPYDPLLTLFAHQELADLQAKSGTDSASELAHRLHVIHFSGPFDGSLRNVTEALELVIKSPESCPDPEQRYDVINGLVQLLRQRWEIRTQSPTKSIRTLLREIDREVVAVEGGMQALGVAADEAGLSAAETKRRQRAIEQVVLRPLRSYREQLFSQAEENRMKTQLILSRQKVQEQTEAAAPAETATPKLLPPDLLKAGNPIW